MSDACVTNGLDGEAYHEAGHAVFAIHLNGWLSPVGVTIDGDCFCDARFQLPRLVPEHIVVPYSLAGDCAEFEFWEEIEPFASRAQVEQAIRAARSGVPPYADLEHAMAILCNTNPYAAEDMLFKRYRVYAEETYDVLQEARVAAAVNMVAGALLEQGRLSAEEVMRIYLRAMSRRSRKARGLFGKADA